MSMHKHIDHIIYGISGPARPSMMTYNIPYRCGKIRGFSPMKFFAEKFRGALATSVHYLPIAKNSWENFRDKLKNRDSLVQRIFLV